MGRKTHMLKLLVKENADAKKSLLDMADDLKKVGLISEKLQVEGLRVGEKVAKIDKISIPTLTSILKEAGFQISKGRPKSDSKPIWISMPQAVSAIESLVESVGMDAAVEHLNKEGVCFGTTKITFKGDNSLSVATLSKVLNRNTKTKVDTKEETKEDEDKEEVISSLAAKSIDDEYDLDEEDEDEEDEGEDEEDEGEDDEDDEFLEDEEDDYEDDDDEEEEEDDDDDYDDEVSDF